MFQSLFCWGKIGIHISFSLNFRNFSWILELHFQVYYGRGYYGTVILQIFKETRFKEVILGRYCWYDKFKCGRLGEKLLWRNSYRKSFKVWIFSCEGAAQHLHLCSVCLSVCPSVCGQNWISSCLVCFPCFLVLMTACLWHYDCWWLLADDSWW